MSPEEQRLAIERAIIELSDVDEALVLMSAAIKRRISTAIGLLANVRDAASAEGTRHEHGGDES